MKTTQCPNCGGSVVLLKQTGGRRMPVNTYSVKADDEEYVPTRHVSHNATCTKRTFRPAMRRGGGINNDSTNE